MTGLSENAKRARAAYFKQWRKNNTEKDKAIRARYWEKKAREMAQAASEQKPADNEK